MASSEPEALFQLFGVAFVAALLIAVFIGVPIGFLASWLLKKLGRESTLGYIFAGGTTALVFAMSLPSRAEFWLAMIVTGVVMAGGYWLAIRKPMLAESSND